MASFPGLRGDRSAAGLLRDLNFEIRPPPHRGLRPIANACCQHTVRRSGTLGFEMLPDGRQSFRVRLAMVVQGLQPRNSWRVTQDASGSILWAGQKRSGRKRVRRIEPDPSLVRQLTFWFYRCLPWEEFL